MTRSSWNWRLARRIIAALAIMVAVAVAAFAKTGQGQTLADGTVLRLEHVGYGTSLSGDQRVPTVGTG